MAGTRTGRLFLLIFCTAMTDCVRAAGQPVASIALDDARVVINAAVMLPVRPCEAYFMLTDYDDLPSFIPGLEESHSWRLANNRVRVRQAGEVQVFVFHVPVTSVLEMEETPGRHIAFHQVEGDMAESYDGSWDFSGSADGTLLDYHAVMSFGPLIPLNLARAVLRHEVSERFDAIVREAGRRKAAGLLHCTAE